MSGWNLDDTRRTLVELQDAGLVNEIAPGIYTLHDLLHAYAQELAEGDESRADRDAAFHRLLDHYLFTSVDLPVAREGAVPVAVDSRGAALRWFALEHPSLLRAVELAAAQGFDGHAWRLPWALVTYLDLQGHRHAFKTTQAIALAAAQRLGNAEAEGGALRHLASRFGQMPPTPGI